MQQYPLGEAIIVLRSLPSRLDMRLACILEDRMGREIGKAESVNAGTWQRVNRFLGGTSASYQFSIMDVGGRPLLHIKRPFTGRGVERFELRSSDGRELAQLVQNNGYRDSHRNFNLESEGFSLGSTQCSNRPYQVVITDPHSRRIARITRERSASYFFGNDFYDYTLSFECIPDETSGYLSLGVLIAEYLDFRLQNGGPLRILYDFNF